MTVAAGCHAGRALAGAEESKGGGDELHGSVFLSGQPFQLTPRTVGRLGEALAYRRRVDGMLGDIGFELSGPLKKDKVWFYIGFAPTVTQYQTDRVLRRASYDPAIQGARRDTGYECPSYLSDPALCRGAQALAIAMEETDSQRFTELRTLYNGIAKLQFNLSPDHNLTLSYIASPKTFSGSYLLGLNQTGMIDDGAYTQTDQVHDATLRYVGKLLSRKLQLSAMYGFHFQGINVAPKQIDKPLQIYLSESTDPYSLADFEDVSGCRRQMQPDGMGGALSFNPCPITTYRRGGFGQYNRTDLQRHQLLLAATYFLDALGTHAIKLGFDFEHLRNKNFRAYTGPGGDPTDGLSANGVYRTSADGQSLRNFAQYSTVGPDGETVLLNSFSSDTFTNNFVLYLREEVLARYPGPVTLFFDDIEALRELPLPLDELWTALRVLHDARNEDKVLQQLRLCLSSSHRPEQLCSAVSSSVFSVTHSLLLPDFSRAELAGFEVTPGKKLGHVLPPGSLGGGAGGVDGEPGPAIEQLRVENARLRHDEEEVRRREHEGAGGGAGGSSSRGGVCE